MPMIFLGLKLLTKNLPQQDRFLIRKWYPQWESNLYHPLRRRVLYPLSYGGFYSYFTKKTVNIQKSIALNFGDIFCKMLEYTILIGYYYGKKFIFFVL